LPTHVTIDGTKFFINGSPTYAGTPVEGLLFNSRMIQAIFDDACPVTVGHWAYPDTGTWDPDRNTDEFCAALPQYRAHGLLGVTVGLQGGGADFAPAIYNHYRNTAFEPDGDLKPAYIDRLGRVLQAADDAGMVVIVNYFYWKQVLHYSDEALLRAADNTTLWLLRSGHRNILVDLANEASTNWKSTLFHPDRVHHAIRRVQGITYEGRRLPVGCSCNGGDALSEGAWLETEDFCLPHGNGLTPEALAAKLRRLKATPAYVKAPKPIVVNEDSVFVENLDAAVGEGCSWGFYCQGYGSNYKDRMDWTGRGREGRHEELSGYQMVPTNWGINTAIKRAFFDRVKALTGGGAC